MNFEKIKYTLKNGTNEEILNLLYRLSDLFESYSGIVDNLDGIIEVLIKYAIEIEDIEIKKESFYCLSNAAVNKDIQHLNFDDLAKKLNTLPAECLIDAIDILSFTHNKKYIIVISQLRTHSDKRVVAAVETALQEMAP